MAHHGGFGIPSQRRPALRKDMSIFSLIRETRTNLELIGKQAEAQVLMLTQLLITKQWMQSVLNENFPFEDDFAKSLEDG